MNVLNVFKQSLTGRIDGTEWCRAARIFRKRMHYLAYMVDSMGMGVDLSDFPRVMHQAMLILESSAGENRNVVNDGEERDDITCATSDRV